MKAVAAATLFVIALGGIKPSIAIQTEVSAHATFSAGDTQMTIPVGEYVALLEIPYPPPTPPTPVPVDDGSYVILFYNIGWNLNGSVNGGPINIYVLNNSNYQDFNSSRQYSMFQQLLNVSGSFKLHIVLPANGPSGTYIFDDNNASYGWWIVFDNRAGLSNATLTLFIESTGSYRFVFHQIGIEEPVLLLVVVVIAGVLFLIGAGIWKNRRGAHLKPEARAAE
jgi:hypothetical protein